MDFKFILTVSLIVVLFLGLANFGYLTYSINGVDPAKLGTDIVKDKQLYFYANAALYVTAFVLSIGIFLKR